MYMYKFVRIYIYLYYWVRFTDIHIYICTHFPV